VPASVHVLSGMCASGAVADMLRLLEWPSGMPISASKGARVVATVLISTSSLDERGPERCLGK